MEETSRPMIILGALSLLERVASWIQKFDNIASVDPSTTFQSNLKGKYSVTKLPKEMES
jgi:hypothetical protein